LKYVRYITYVYETNDEIKGFVSFHIQSQDSPGYADGYDGWG